jgi:cytidine deaminase
MRNQELFGNDPNDNEFLATTARRLSKWSMDTYSEYGVGAALSITFGSESKVYSGCNINLSGMENKIHAEQLAAFQALIDMQGLGLKDEGGKKYFDLNKIVVVTTENDLALRCGHCFQVLNGICSYTETDPYEFEYIAAANNSDGEWEFIESTLGDEFGDSYVDRRGVNE